MSNSNKRKKQHIQKNIESTEQLLNQWEEKKRNSENPNETNRCQTETSKLERILDEYENELEGLSKQNSNNDNVELSKELHFTIQKALKYLENANYADYFEEMDNVEIPTELKAIYQESKMKMMTGNIPFNFEQSLRLFAKEINKKL